MFGGRKNSRAKCPEFFRRALLFCRYIKKCRSLYCERNLHSESKQPERDPNKVVSGSGFGLILGVGGNKNSIRLKINFAQPNFVMRILQSLIISDEILK